MSGNWAASDRIAGSNASTDEPFGARRYLGGSCDANALATVFLENSRRLAVAARDSRSDTYSRRISAQSSTLITPQAVELQDAQLSPIDYRPVFMRRRHPVLLARGRTLPAGHPPRRWPAGRDRR
jgi:hypothetical protein